MARAKQPIEFENGSVLSVLGRQFVVKIYDSSARFSHARVVGSEVRVWLAGCAPEERNEIASSLARKALSRALMPELEARINAINDAHFHARLGRVRLKDTMRNWGSCSVHNDINLDFRLLFAPAEVLDAVIVHELAHAIVKNHSKAFYERVYAAMPEYRERYRWLRANAGRLLPAQGNAVAGKGAEAEGNAGIAHPQPQ